MKLAATMPLAPTAAVLRSGQSDLCAFIEDICDRIDAVDAEIQALLPEPDRRARLLHEAALLQDRYPYPDIRPPLFGIPLGVKDIYAVDGFPTYAGSQLPPTLFQRPEASCVTRLRKAGALILGKTVTTEFAFFEPGPTRNPHNLAHTPGGSSSGSAAAVAAGFCPLALGSQTIGSILRPAAFCGIVGFKPGHGRVATDGLIFSSISLDTVGFFAQDVDGIALVAPLLFSHWQPSSPARKPILAVPDGPYLAQASPEAQVAFSRQVSLLENAGYEVRHIAAMFDIDAINQRHRRIVAAEMAQMHMSWFAQYESLYRQRSADLIREGQQVSAAALESALAGRHALRDELENLMRHHRIDLWISPAATGTAPQGITTTGDPVMNLPWTHAGLPAIALPAGYAANGLPLGLQVAAGYMADEQLLAWTAPIAEVLKATAIVKELNRTQ